MWLLNVLSKEPYGNFFVCFIYVSTPPLHDPIKMLGCFNPTLVQIWTNPAVGLHFYIDFLTQKLGQSIFDTQFGLKQTIIF